VSHAYSEPTMKAPPPSINAIQNQTVTAGNQVTINASSPSNPTPTWAWAAVAGNPAAPALTQTPSPATASPTSALRFTPTVAGTYRFTVRATNANGTSSPVTVTITVTAAVPANITLTNEYRTGKQRLIITATTPDPNVTTMVLQPYLTENGTTFDPTTLGANLTVSLTAPGTWTLTAVGAPHFCSPAAEAAVKGRPATDETFRAAGAAASAECNPSSDQRGPAEYKRHLAGELTVRALRRAVARAQGLEG